MGDLQTRQRRAAEKTQREKRTAVENKRLDNAHNLEESPKETGPEYKVQNRPVHKRTKDFLRRLESAEEVQESHGEESA